jgi:hypothetical protein
VRCPLPPGGSARIKKAPQPGQVGRPASPMANNLWPLNYDCLFGSGQNKAKIYQFQRPIPFKLNHRGPKLVCSARQK